MKKSCAIIISMFIGAPKPSMKVLRELSSPVELPRLQQGKKGKATVEVPGSIGLPQHTVKGYKLYLSDKTRNYLDQKLTIFQV